MFQRDQLFDWRNIFDNVVLGLELQNRLDEDSSREARELLDSYG